MFHFENNFFLPCFLLILITTECNNLNIENQKNLQIQQIEDSMHVYEYYNDLWFDMDSSINHSNEKFIKSRDSIYNIPSKNPIQKRDSIIIRTIEIYNGPCGVIRWVPMDSKRYIRVPIYFGGVDSIESFIKNEFRTEIFNTIRDTATYRKFNCKFDVSVKAQNIILKADETDTLLVYSYFQEINRIIHILPCWSISNFKQAESKDSLLDNFEIRKKNVSFDILLNKERKEINITNYQSFDE